MGNSIFQTLLSVITLLHGLSSASVDFCKNHLFDNVVGKNILRFSKENSDREFAVIDGFKSLHCCSQGYRSIEWFKNGIPYPWSTDVSTLIISPESGNQTIYSQVISAMDSGNYLCIVRNDTHSLRHDVFLKVSVYSDIGDESDQIIHLEHLKNICKDFTENSFSDSHESCQRGGSSELEEPPKVTYTPRDQWIDIGQKARFYCEAFVGNISLPDAKSEISWRKLNVNTSVPTEGRVRQEIVSREGNQVLGSYLFISRLKIEDYGNYICTVSNTGDQFLELNASLFKKDNIVKINYTNFYIGSLIVKIALVLLAVITSTISMSFFSSRFRLMYKKFCRKSHSKNNEEYDIFVAYHEKDSDFALNKTVSTLQNSYQCKCVVHPVTFGKLVTGCKEVKEKSNKSKRLLLVLSPALAENEWTCKKLNAILTSLIDIHPRIITVLLQPLPSKDQMEDADALQDLLQRAYCIEYKESKIQRFWDLLALGLPSFSVGVENQEIDDLV